MHDSTRIRLWTLIACVVLLGGWVGHAAASRSRAKSDLYDRSLERHIERTQAKLLDTLELWEDHSTWETAWRVRTEHYEVRTTRSRAFGLDLAQGLETMLGHFQRVLDTDFAPTERFQVLIFPTLEAYNQYGNDFGAEHSSFQGSFYADQAPERAVAAVDDDNPTRLRMAVTHNAFHQFVSHAYTQAPPLWVDEGLASYFALFWDYGYGVRELERIRADDRLVVPIDELLAGQIASYTDRTHSRFIQLGMLFTYLLSYREGTRTVVEGDREVEAPFARYLRALFAGGDTDGDEVGTLLTERRAELEDALRTFDFGG